MLIYACICIGVKDDYVACFAVSYYDVAGATFQEGYHVEYKCSKNASTPAFLLSFTKGLRLNCYINRRIKTHTRSPLYGCTDIFSAGFVSAASLQCCLSFKYYIKGLSLFIIPHTFSIFLFCFRPISLLFACLLFLGRFYLILQKPLEFIKTTFSTTTKKSTHSHTLCE